MMIRNPFKLTFPAAQDSSDISLQPPAIQPSMAQPAVAAPVQQPAAATSAPVGAQNPDLATFLKSLIANSQTAAPEPKPTGLGDVIGAGKGSPDILSALGSILGKAYDYSQTSQGKNLTAALTRDPWTARKLGEQAMQESTQEDLNKQNWAQGEAQRNKNLTELNKELMQTEGQKAKDAADLAAKASEGAENRKLEREIAAQRAKDAQADRDLRLQIAKLQASNKQEDKNKALKLKYEADLSPIRRMGNTLDQMEQNIDASGVPGTDKTSQWKTAAALAQEIWTKEISGRGSRYANINTAEAMPSLYSPVAVRKAKLAEMRKRVDAMKNEVDSKWQPILGDAIPNNAASSNPSGVIQLDAQGKIKR